MMIAGWDREKRTMDIIFFILGTSISKPASPRDGESVTNVAYHLEKPAEAEKSGTIICARCCYCIGSTLPLIKPLEKKCNNSITVVPTSKKVIKGEKG